MFKKNEIRAKQLYLKLDESDTYFLSSHIVSKTPYFVFIFLATLLLGLFLDYPDARTAALIYLVALIGIRTLIAVNGRLNSLLLEPQFSSDKWLTLTSVHRARRIFTKYSELSTFTLLTNKGYATELNETLRLLEETLVVINKSGDIATQEELIYTLINLLDKLDMILPDSCSIEPKSTKKRIKDERQVDEKTVLERARKFNDNWS